MAVTGNQKVKITRMELDRLRAAARYRRQLWKERERYPHMTDEQFRKYVEDNVEMFLRTCYDVVGPDSLEEIEVDKEYLDSLRTVE